MMNRRGFLRSILTTSALVAARPLLDLTTAPAPEMFGFSGFSSRIPANQLLVMNPSDWNVLFNNISRISQSMLDPYCPRGSIYVTESNQQG